MSDGGVNRKIKKLYANVGGVNREIKQLWAKQGGVNRKMFNSGIRARIEKVSSQGDATYSWNSNGGGSLTVPAPTADQPTLISIQYKFDDEYIKYGTEFLVEITYTLSTEVLSSTVDVIGISPNGTTLMATKNDAFSSTDSGAKVVVGGNFFSNYSLYAVEISLRGPRSGSQVVLSWATSSIKITVDSETLPISDVYK